MFAVDALPSFLARGCPLFSESQAGMGTGPIGIVREQQQDYTWMGLLFLKFRLVQVVSKYCRKKVLEFVKTLVDKETEKRECHTRTI